jgi:hypothetical protein
MAHRRWQAIAAEAADGEVFAVVEEARNGVLDGHHLVEECAGFVAKELASMIRGRIRKKGRGHEFVGRLRLSARVDAPVSSR